MSDQTTTVSDEPGMTCPHCGYVGEMRADYYEAVWQYVSGTFDEYDYTGTYGSYDDGSTENECLRCPECFNEVVEYGTFLFIPTALLERVQGLLEERYGALLTTDRLLRKSDVADWLGISSRSVDRLAAAGQLERIHIRGSTRFRAADVEALVERSREAARVRRRIRHRADAPPGRVMSGHTIVLSRDDTAAFMAAVADLEQTAGEDNMGPCSFWTDGEFGRGGGEELTVASLLEQPVSVLSRIAGVIDGQVSDGQVSEGRTWTDAEALDELNLMLSAPAWPGASGMEDVCAVVRRTGRKEVPNAPEWDSH